ncbi:MAG: DNA polymerase III subunit epsilon, partial [Symbiopectobacterium sp.]
RIMRQSSALPIIYASQEELAAHETRLDLIAKKGGSCLWRQ